MKKWMKFAWIVVPIVILGLIGMKLFTFFFDFHSVGQAYGRGSFVPQHGFHGGRAGQFQGSPYQMMHGHVAFFGLALFAFLLKLAMVIGGWFMWRNRKVNNLIKGCGALIFTIGMYSILPMVLGVSFLFLMAFLTFKTLKKKQPWYKDLAVNDIGVIQTQNYKQPDFLDEWENRVRREETNNGDF